MVYAAQRQDASAPWGWESVRVFSTEDDASAWLEREGLTADAATRADGYLWRVRALDVEDGRGPVLERRRIPLRHAREPEGAGPRVPIEVVVFVVGAASLGAEIAAARLLAPYFGSSTIVWANTIGVVLVALSVGYWWGGRVADRGPRYDRLFRLIVAGGAALAVVPLVGRPYLTSTIGTLDSLSLGAFFGSLLGVLVLVAGPVLLLGAVSPFAVRLSVRRVDEAGATAGRLYAIGTAGSLVGTFLAALVLIPFVGTHRTFLLFALSVTLIGALGLGRRWLVVPLAVAVLVALPPGGIKTTSADGRVIYETETPYQYARVVEAPGGTRQLEIDDSFSIHSLYVPGSYLSGDYWDEFLVLPVAVLGRPPANVAILGNAAGTTARSYGHFFPATRVDGVDIDARITEIGRRWFDLHGPRLRLVTADARPFLRTSGRYDAIFLDAYREPEIPFYLATREFFDLCRRHLAPGGVLIANVAHSPGFNAIEQVLTRTMRAAFPAVARDGYDDSTTLLVASAAPASPARLLGKLSTLPGPLRRLGRAAATRLTTPLRGGAVYTDDRAPMEWLVDRDVIQGALTP
jgi:spermidine synthase